MSSQACGIWRSKSRHDGDNRYIDLFFRSKCAADLLHNGLFPNAKEVTESHAAFQAVWYYLTRFERSDPNITVVVIGGGKQPRTASLFACKTKWQTISVDPVSTEGSLTIRRVETRKCRIEETTVKADKAIVLAVHSHANLQQGVDRVEANDKAVVAIPCCYSQDLHRDPDHIYDDMGIWSPKRTVKIWTKI